MKIELILILLDVLFTKFFIYFANQYLVSSSYYILYSDIAIAFNIKKNIKILDKNWLLDEIFESFFKTIYSH